MNRQQKKAFRQICLKLRMRLKRQMFLGNRKTGDYIVRIYGDPQP